MVIKTQDLLNVYGFMLASRESDIIETELVNSGEANFLASSGGHEGSAIVSPFLRTTDWLHCHYRDKALMMARGVSNEMFFYSALAKAESHSSGRQMVSHMSAPELNLMSLVGPVGNNALQAVGVAMAIKNKPDQPIVFCSIGDGTSQQGEVFEAIAEAKRSHLPVLFFIHNNNLAISTRTDGKTFFSLPNGTHPSHFYDIPISYLDGTRPLEQYAQLDAIVSKMRVDRYPQIIVFNVERLDDHSNSDNQQLYRSLAEIEFSQRSDPIKLSYQYLLNLGITAQELEQLKTETLSNVRLAVDRARSGTNPIASFVAEAELPKDLERLAQECRGNFEDNERLTMLQAMRNVFDYQLKQDDNVCLLGEDIEDGKGDVFGITKGLSTKYPGRVVNSALSESTIVGLSAGMALAGKKPVAFIQFADFLPCAYNQIFTEIATMYWRTNGGWQCPVIIFAACGGYRPGLGPFHSQTNEATFAHIPGLDVYMPSNASDASGMLNAAFKSGRPSLFLYPKKLLNNRSIVDTASYNVHEHLVPVSKARIVKSGTDITLVGWGNTVSLSLEVADTLEAIGYSAEVIDLRTIKPYDKAAILLSAEKTRHLIVSHEDNLTCGLGGDILATVAEYAKYPIKLARIARPDTYTPCNYPNQIEVLPSYEKILTSAAKLLNLNLTWQEQVIVDESLYTLEVIGVSPSDETVLINRIYVKCGDQIKAGDILVDIESTKSIGEILSPYAGTVEEICVELDEHAIIGKPLIKIRLASDVKKIIQSKPRKAILTKKDEGLIDRQTKPARNYIDGRVGIALPQFRVGSRITTNAEILPRFPELTEDDIVQRTGIKQRAWLESGESAVGLAVDAAIMALNKQSLQLNNIDLIICATCTPEQYQSPSTACLILNELNKIYASDGTSIIPAYDLNAACSGYIYALQSAQDFLRTRPNARVLLLTAEALSSRTNPNDFETAFLFADGASATIVCGENHLDECVAEIQQIYLGSYAEDGSILNLPSQIDIGINMQGKKLFSIAVKSMALAINKCCNLAGVNVESIDLAIPHQANQRILSAVERLLKLRSGIMFSNIATYGNTSSCTIPIAFNEALIENIQPKQIAICAFGGGFTNGAALLKTL